MTRHDLNPASPGDGSTVLFRSRESTAGLEVAWPRVCVIITCFNYATYVSQALDSVASQTYPNFECIVVDDCSTDDSVKVVERWMAATGDRRFRLLKSTSNKGQLAGLIEALKQSDSEFVATLDADDFFFPDFLRRHLEIHLNAFGSAALSTSEVVQVDEERRLVAGNLNGRRLWESRGQGGELVPVPEALIQHVDPNGYWQPPERRAAVFVAPGAWTGHWTAMSCMFRRSMLDLVVPDDPAEMRLCADHYLIQMCHYFTGSFFLDEPLSAYRRHRQNLYAHLPVYGGRAFVTRHDQAAHLDGSFQAMLRHVIERRDRFAAIFGSRAVSALVRTLFRQLLRGGHRLDEPAIRSIIGRSEFLQIKLREWLRHPFRRRAGTRSSRTPPR